jgi:hypothetical protein
MALILVPHTTMGQVENGKNKPESTFKSRLFFGGGFGLQFGSVTLIELSPLAGYKITPKFAVGISPTYKYYQFKDYYNQTFYYKTNVFGASVFARYLVFENVFAHAEYETLYYNTKVSGSGIDRRQYNSVLVGGGYRQPIGENAAMNLMVLWNLNDTPDSPYTNPVIRVGFTIGM